jgi:hypothetical protein
MQTSPSDYRKRAADCVEMAQNASAPERMMLLKIAAAWVNLADVTEKEMAIDEMPAASKTRERVV